MTHIRWECCSELPAQRHWHLKGLASNLHIICLFFKTFFSVGDSRLLVSFVGVMWLCNIFVSNFDSACIIFVPCFVYFVMVICKWIMMICIIYNIKALQLKILLSSRKIEYILPKWIALITTGKTRKKESRISFITVARSPWNPV